MYWHCNVVYSGNNGFSDKYLKRVPLTIFLKSLPLGPMFSEVTSFKAVVFFCHSKMPVAWGNVGCNDIVDLMGSWTNLQICCVIWESTLLHANVVRMQVGVDYTLLTTCIVYGRNEMIRTTKLRTTHVNDRRKRCQRACKIIDLLQEQH